MKKFKNLIAPLLLTLVLVASSCRTEESIFIDTPAEKQLIANSPVATLMQRTATNDGSNDNIVDGSNCFNVAFPFSVVANGVEITVTSEAGLAIIESIFDEFEDDDNTLDIIFPVTITLADFTEVVLNNIAELNEYRNSCSGENEVDDDIECIDFQYPITASLFNTNNELIETVTISSDEDLYEFLEELDASVIAAVEFPITVVLADGTEVVINNLTELETVIANAQDDCDEDDDNDWDDDDCDNCTDSNLIEVLTTCTDWKVEKLERNDTNKEDTYVGYSFDFLENGTINISYNASMYTGTWEAVGTGNDIIVAIVIPDLPDFTNDWELHEVEDEDHEAKIDLRLNDDKLKFESECNGGNSTVDDTALVNALTDGYWYVTYYFDDNDKTHEFTEYKFEFKTDGDVKATNSAGTTIGSWFTGTGNYTPLELNISFGSATTLEELNEDWDVLEVSGDKIRLKDVSSSNGEFEYLTFERTQSSNGSASLTEILKAGIWEVAYYEDNDGTNLTDSYSDYEIDFSLHTLVVNNTANGTQIAGQWSVENFGNIIEFDFGSTVPFDEFNEDWDVISVTETFVILHHVSGGNSGTDILKLERK